MGLLRDISNRLHGRKKIESKHQTLQEILDRLEFLDESININIVYGIGSWYFHSFKNQKSKEASHIIAERFDQPQEKRRYFEADCEVFAGRKIQKHYIWVKNGFVDKYGFRDPPSRDASVCYAVKDKGEHEQSSL